MLQGEKDLNNIAYFAANQTYSYKKKGFTDFRKLYSNHTGKRRMKYSNKSLQKEKMSKDKKLLGEIGQRGSQLSSPVIFYLTSALRPDESQQ